MQTFFDAKQPQVSVVTVQGNLSRMLNIVMGSLGNYILPCKKIATG